jgi:Rrf2 family protein
MVSMLTKSTLMAIRGMVYLALQQDRANPVSPKRLAEYLNASPTYMAKIVGALVKADLLRSHRGIQGGVTLERDPEAISLLEIVEVSQGKILADYCEDCDRMHLVCAFHKAMFELHTANIEILERWTLAQLVAKPGPSKSIRDAVACEMGLYAKEVQDAASAGG